MNNMKKTKNRTKEETKYVEVVLSLSIGDIGGVNKTVLKRLKLFALFIYNISSCLLE